MIWTQQNKRNCGWLEKSLCVCMSVYLYISMKVKVLVTQSCLTLWDMDCSSPGNSVHGILQARTLEWIASPFSRGSSRPRVKTQVSRIAGRFFAVWATREAQYRYMNVHKYLLEWQSQYLNPEPMFLITVVFQQSPGFIDTELFLYERLPLTITSNVAENVCRCASLDPR